jgi:hypothetical protein
LAVLPLAGYMQHDLVEQRRWISREDYLEGLALAQLAPGLLAAQLAIYLRCIREAALGATLVGFAFIAPSFLMVLALAKGSGGEALLYHKTCMRFEPIAHRDEGATLLPFAARVLPFGLVLWREL